MSALFICPAPRSRITFQQLWCCFPDACQLVYFHHMCLTCLQRLKASIQLSHEKIWSVSARKLMISILHLDINNASPTKSGSSLFSMVHQSSYNVVENHNTYIYNHALPPPPPPLMMWQFLPWSSSGRVRWYPVLRCLTASLYLLHIRDFVRKVESIHNRLKEFQQPFKLALTCPGPDVWGQFGYDVLCSSTASIL